LVGIVIRVTEAKGRGGTGQVRDAGQPVEQVVLLGGGHPQRIPVRERNLTDERGIRKIRVAGGVRAAQDLGQSGGIVIAVTGADSQRRNIRPAQQVIVNIGHADAAQYAAGVTFGQQQQRKISWHGCRIGWRIQFTSQQICNPQLHLNTESSTLLWHRRQCQGLLHFCILESEYLKTSRGVAFCHVCRKSIHLLTRKQR